MKILSKYKDYYDFIAGFDKDSHIVYERQFKRIISKSYYECLKNRRDLAEVNVSFPVDRDFGYNFALDIRDARAVPESYGRFIGLAFCDTLYNIFRTTAGEYIYTFEDFVAKVDPKSKLLFTKDYGYTGHNFKFEPFKPIKTDINKTLGFPVVADFPRGVGILYDGAYINPKLSDLHFGSLKSATECYQDIYNWISEQKPEIKMPSSPDDMSRYEAKGFDKKISFRNIK